MSRTEKAASRLIAAFAWAGIALGIAAFFWSLCGCTPHAEPAKKSHTTHKEKR